MYHSEAYNAFHSRSPTAKKYLNSLPSRPTDNKVAASTDDPLVADFKKLRDDLVDKGFFKPSPTHVAYRMTELLLMHLGGFYLMSAGVTTCAFFATRTSANCCPPCQQYTVLGLALLGLASVSWSLTQDLR
jgi:hypothetical protein